MTIDDRLRADGATWRAAVAELDEHLVPARQGEMLVNTPVASPPTRGRRRPTLGLRLSIVVLLVLAVAGGAAAAYQLRDGDSGIKPSDGGGRSVFGLPITPASASPLRPEQLPSYVTLHPVRILRTRPDGHLISMPWTLLGLRDDGRTLVIKYISGDGIKPDGVNAVGFKVLLHKHNIELIAVSRDSLNSDGEAASLALGYGTIRLPTALGSRALLHPPTNNDWPARLLR